jgi:GTPases - Sulfate adenylate transferase subunit 1
MNMADKKILDAVDTELLRFTTAGSVDDGKSTLIGRLLVDSKGVFEDQLDAAKSAEDKKGAKGAHLALLTDGLQAEREQGITIDVAYRYFATPKRKFIIADTPGHEQYTRNMVTGASSAHLAIILIDARKGVLVQSRRHAYISLLLGIPHLVVAINKMDLVDYSQEVYERIKADFTAFYNKLNLGGGDFPLSRSRRWKATWWSSVAATCRGIRARRCWESWKAHPWKANSTPRISAFRYNWYRARKPKTCMISAAIWDASNLARSRSVMRSPCCRRG